MATKRIAESINTRLLWAMATIKPADSGIAGVDIGIHAGILAGTKLRYGPRVRVYELGGSAAAVTIHESPRVVVGTLPALIKKQVFSWVALNRAVLLEHWRGNLNDGEALNSIRSINPPEPLKLYHPALRELDGDLQLGEFLTDMRVIAKRMGLDQARKQRRKVYYMYEFDADVELDIGRVLQAKHRWQSIREITPVKVTECSAVPSKSARPSKKLRRLPTRR